MKTKAPKRRIWTLKKADEKFSLYIRERDGKCMRCLKVKPAKELTCSHFWVRQHKATRFDPENCVALCWMPCHKYHWEKEKQGAYREFMLKWLGTKKYNALQVRSVSVKPEASAIIDCMKLLGELQ